MTDTTSDEYQRQLPTPWASVFGDHGADLDIFTDQPPDQPARNSSAARLATRVRTRERAAQTDLEERRIRVVAQEQREDEALQRAVDLYNRHGRPGAETRALAVAALARRGGSNLTSAEVMAARALRAPGWTDDQGA